MNARDDLHQCPRTTLQPSTDNVSGINQFIVFTDPDGQFYHFPYHRAQQWQVRHTQFFAGLALVSLCMNTDRLSSKGAKGLIRASWQPGRDDKPFSWKDYECVAADGSVIHPIYWTENVRPGLRFSIRQRCRPALKCPSTVQEQPCSAQEASAPQPLARCASIAPKGNIPPTNPRDSSKPPPACNLPAQTTCNRSLIYENAFGFRYFVNLTSCLTWEVSATQPPQPRCRTC